MQVFCFLWQRKEVRSMNWFQEAFAKFGEMNVFALVIVLILIGCAAIGAVLLYRKKKAGTEIAQKGWAARELTAAALCIAAAFLLSFIKLFSMPMGGSITPASMLPIMAFAYIYGVRKGLVVGIVYSLLQFLQEPFFVAPAQFLLDYTGAFSLLALAGLAKKNIVPGILYACGARFVCQYLSGVIFFGMYAPEGMPAWLYSLGYSGTVVGVEAAICVAVALIPGMNGLLNRMNREQVKRRAAAHSPSA
ncbi:MAG TPA: energy-coupled thiamine transporter ThiT [Clostridiales bacterium]|nr:energy-coupled thiamine transporter ThiT [Clostridiales bacterium]